jgi:RecA/RadA recombinase
MVQQAASLEALRERIRAIEGRPVQRARPPSGVAALDQLLGGLPTPGVIELSGPVGSGRSSVALALAGWITGHGSPVAWVDVQSRFYPPAAAGWGVALARLLVVRPPSDREGWSIEQLLRSGVFPLVVAADPSPVRAATAHRWAQATEVGGSVLLVLTERGLRSLPAGVRLSIRAGQLTALRDPERPPGPSVDAPSWPLGADPWG